MKKNVFGILTAVVMLLTASAFAGEALTPTAAPEATLAPDAPQALAQAAVAALYPSAVIDYAVEELDDGRTEWKVFFTDGTKIGECEVDGATYTVREKELYEKPADGLTAAQAVEKLIAAKGELTIEELSLDWDDGALWFEGEAVCGGVRYEFEMTASGVVVEWER